MPESRLELRPVRAGVVLCLGDPRALDAVVATPGALAIPVAPDEILLLSSPERAAGLAEDANASLRTVDAHALALETTDAWSVWSLAGDAAVEAFERLSAVPVPEHEPRIAQGALCGVGAKIFVVRERICVMVSSLVGHHVRARVQQMCRDLEPTFGEPWTFEHGTAASPPPGDGSEAAGPLPHEDAS